MRYIVEEGESEGTTVWHVSDTREDEDSMYRRIADCDNPEDANLIVIALNEYRND